MKTINLNQFTRRFKHDVEYARTNKDQVVLLAGLAAATIGGMIYTIKKTDA